MVGDQRANAEVHASGLKILRIETATTFDLKIWYPKAQKPTFYYSYRSNEKREADVQRIIECFVRRQEEKKRTHEQLREGNMSDVALGTVFYTSWGYDQTNVDYYQVVGVTARCVKIREIASEVVHESGSPSGMACYVRPWPDQFIEEKIMTKRVSFFQGRPSIRIDGHLASVVAMTRFENAPPLVHTKQYRSWYG